MESPWDGGTKLCSNGHGHMTKMATMPICGKNLKKSSSPEPKGWWPWNLVCSIGCSKYFQFYSNDDTFKNCFSTFLLWNQLMQIVGRTWLNLVTWTCGSWSEGQHDLYFKVQCFCLIVWRLFDVCTLTYFTARSNLVPYGFVWRKR